MWDDVKIGEGETGASATRCNFDFGIHSIAENRVSYWVNLKKPSIGMLVMKNTAVGEEIKNIIESNDPAEMLYDLLLGEAAKRIDPRKLCKLFNAQVEQAFNAGYDKAKAELRAWLGVR